MSDMIHLFHDGRIEQSGTPEQIYTSPATKFAATFIGNYNLLKTEDFNRIFQADLQGHDVAVRPEIIQLSKDAVREKSRELMAEGIIINHIPHGSLTRYQVDCQGVSLNADVVFEKQMEFHETDHVFVKVDPDLVIRL